MKYLLTLFFALALLINVEAQDSGIQFAHTDWKTTLQKAQEEDKLIFVDCYTDWCGPCKWMSANVFPDEKVAALYNDKFINIKLNMEKGEGLAFAKEYGIRAYPTLMFINGDGEMVHQAVGSRATDGFIELGTAALDPNQQIGSLSKQYKAGNHQPDFLMGYAKAMQSSGAKGSMEIAEEYLASQKDWTTEDNMKFIYEMVDYKMDSKLFKYMKDHRTEFHKVIGKGEVDDKLKGAVYVSLMNQKGSTEEYIYVAYKAVFPDDYRQYSQEHILNDLMYSKKEGAAEKFLTAAVAYTEKYPSLNWNMLNSLSWRFYELTDDPKLLQQARAWAKKSVSLDSNYMNNDTLAAVCYKLKEKAPATKHAKLAIELAKKDGNDATETKELLEKINAL